MKNTGERHFITSNYNNESDYYIHLIHIASYNFVLKHSEGKEILDFGCGSGYGSKLLSEKAKKVFAVDINQEAIDFAKQNYSAENIEFINITEFNTHYTNNKFDIITSFQVIEHIADTEKYLKSLYNWLKPNGQLFITTPNKSNRLFNYIQKPWNQYHIKEFNDIELAKRMKKFFTNVEILKMTSVPELVNHEIKRTKKLKLITLPFTLFFYPNLLRIFLLNLQSRFFIYLSSYRKKTNKPKPINITNLHEIILNFSISDIEISKNPKNPTDIFVICTKDNDLNK